jgi:hypothetical protein
LKITVALPPNFDAIDAEFNLKGINGLVFAYGDTIYNPDGAAIPPAIIAHEMVHGERQGSDVEGWWARYIKDEAFRLAEEIPAHRAEYRRWMHDPNARRAVKGFRCELDWRLFNIARRLSSPLYGNLVSMGTAKTLLVAPEAEVQAWLQRRAA